MANEELEQRLDDLEILVASILIDKHNAEHPDGDQAGVPEEAAEEAAEASMRLFKRLAETYLAEDDDDEED